MSKLRPVERNFRK